MENWLIEVMNDYGYVEIMFLITIENIFPPILSEVILTFGGGMTTTSSLSILGIIISATAGFVSYCSSVYFCKAKEKSFLKFNVL